MLTTIVVIVAILLSISSYLLAIPAEYAGSSLATASVPSMPLSLGHLDVFQYDFNVTYSPSGSIATINTLHGMVFILDSKLESTPNRFSEISLKIGFYINLTQFDLSASSLSLSVWEPFSASGSRLIYSSPFLLSESAGQLSLVSLHLQELGLYRMVLQNTGMPSVVGFWTYRVSLDFLIRPQYNYGIATFAIAVVITGGAPLVFYVNRRRSHDLSSPSSPISSL